jgi:hypothetical protein
MQNEKVKRKNGWNVDCAGLTGSSEHGAPNEAWRFAIVKLRLSIEDRSS